MDLFNRKKVSNLMTLNEQLTQEIKRSEEESQKSVSLNLPFARYDKLKPQTLSTFYSCMNLISNSLASLNIYLCQDKEGRKSVVENDLVTPLFSNLRMGKFNTIKKLVQDIILRGNGYLLKDIKGGKVVGLRYLKPSQVTIQVDEIKDIVKYQVSNTDKSFSKLFDEKEIIHFFMLTNDGYIGQSIMSFTDGKTTDLATYCDSSASDYFSSGMMAKAILSYKNRRDLSDEQKADIRRNWQQVHSVNGENSGLAVLTGDTTFQVLGNKADDSQLLESREFNVEELCRLFNIHPALVGDTKTSMNDVEQGQILFLTNTLNPWIKMFEEKFNKGLLEGYDKSYYINMDETELLKANKSNLASFLNTLCSGGIMSVNECRKFLNLNSVEGGDDLMKSFTDIEQNKINQDTNEENKEETIEDYDY